MGDSHKDDRYNDGQYNSDNRENIDNKGNSEAADASAGGTGNLNFRKFYLFTLAVLGALSAYPLINGVRIAYIGVMHGAVEPGQYARYVIPYTAMCVAILLFAAFLPVLFRVKRMAFLVGLSGAYAVFIALELFMENIKISTKGMTVLDPASLTADMTAPPFASVDIWQASMCAVSPLVRGQSKVFSSGDGIFYVMANDAYKIHYYLVSFILITMVCGLVYGIGHAVSTGAEDRRKPLILQGMAAAALVSLCVFANTTAFFRQTGPIDAGRIRADMPVFHHAGHINRSVCGKLFSQKGQGGRSGAADTYISGDRCHDVRRRGCDDGWRSVPLRHRLVF